jgi:ParB/RepB/Spo0J family partition protein
MNQVVELDIASIQNFNDNVRATTETHIESLAADIKTNGLMHPITVRNADGELYEAIAGKRRLAACKLLGFTQIQATVCSANDSEAFLLSLSENMHRHQMSNRERCVAIQRCLVECGDDVSKVANITHLAEPTIRRYLKIGQLPSDVIDRLDAPGEDRISLKEAYGLTRPEAPQPDGEPTDGEPPAKKPRKKSIKSHPWVLSPEGEPIAIPEVLYPSICALILQSAS